MVDALARAPSQDIIRPFDSFAPRPSDSKSISKRKNRVSLVGNTPPTVDAPEDSFTPFGDAFKSFAQESNLKPWVTASDGATPSLTSGTTLDTSPEEAAISSATPRNVTSPTPSKRSGSYFKRFKNRVASYWQVDSSDRITEQRSASDPAATPKANAAPKIVVANSMEIYGEKNSSSTSLGFGSIRKLGRRSRESRGSIADDKTAVKSAEGAPKVSLEPPSSPGANSTDDSQASAHRYGPGVLLHPIVEEDK